MKIWQLTFLDSAYLKYESKLKLPLLPKNALISVFQASFSGFRPDVTFKMNKTVLFCKMHN